MSIESGEILKSYSDSASAQTIAFPPTVTLENTFIVGRTDYKIHAFDIATRTEEVC
jgi:hypothetical protein